jgi:hypothetical protein
VRGQRGHAGQHWRAPLSRAGEHGDRSAAREVRSGVPPSLVGDQLADPGDGPIIYIYITLVHSHVTLSIE